MNSQRLLQDIEALPSRFFDMKPIGFIYLTTCLLTNKIYVGKHEFSKDRWRNSSYLGSGKYFKRALRKYGRENFKREILKVCFNINQLNGYETYYIIKFQATDRKIGYNISKGGYGFRSGELNPCYGDGTKNPFYGKKHTEETKKKMSVAHQKPSKLKGVKLSIETRRKMSESAKLRMSNPANNPMFGQKHSEESKLKNKLSHLGKGHSDETRKKMSLSRIGVKHYWSKRKVS